MAISLNTDTQTNLLAANNNLATASGGGAQPNTTSTSAPAGYGPAVIISLSPMAELSLSQVADVVDTVFVTERRPYYIGGGAGSFSGWGETDGTGIGIGDIGAHQPVQETTPTPPPEPPYTEKKFESKDQAIAAGITEINNHPQRNAKELAFVVYKDPEGNFRVGALMVGEINDEGLGLVNAHRSDFPSDTVAYVHSHPDAALGDGSRERNRWPSEDDLKAWNKIEEWTGHSDISFGVVDPFGIVRIWNNQSELPPLSGSSPIYVPPTETEFPDPVYYRRKPGVQEQ